MSLSNTKQTARDLLIEWNECKRVHYSTNAQFNDAVNIEILKDALTQHANLLKTDLLNNSPDDVMEHRVDMFKESLRSFKDHVTIEILKNGS